jgi:hypothetical protein
VPAASRTAQASAARLATDPSTATTISSLRSVSMVVLPSDRVSYTDGGTAARYADAGDRPQGPGLSALIAGDPGR